MGLRGTPGLGRLLALPVGCLTAAALGGSLALAVHAPGHGLGLASVSVGLFGLLQLARAQRELSRRRHLADAWLRSATGMFVATPFAWRAAQICSPHRRRMLARILRSIMRSANQRPLGRRCPPHLPAVREHADSLEALARALEDGRPVTPAGMLRVADLLSDGASPLWATTKGAPLGEAISATLEILKPRATDTARAA